MAAKLRARKSRVDSQRAAVEFPGRGFEGRGMSELVRGADGLARCPWGASSPEYLHYHDEEWGRPVGDDPRIYEKLGLEGCQSGLSWESVRYCGSLGR
jgi:hypothetical protein